MEIRTMEAGDIPQIAYLETVCFSDPWSERSIASELENRLACWLVAVEDSTVLGYIGSQTVLDGTDIMNIAVAPEARRQGIGELLLNSLIDILKERGVHFLMLEVRQSNAAAIALYRKSGFAEVGVRPNYYRNPRENALIMRKEWDV